MADWELLMRRKDNVHPDSEKDKGSYKQGDIVEIKPAGFTWGNREDPRLFADPKKCNFVILRVTGVTKTLDEMKAWLVSHYDGGDDGQKLPTRRRLWGFLINDVPQSLFDELRDNGVAVRTWNQVRTFIKNKVTQETE